LALKQTYLSMKSKLPADADIVLVMRGRGNDELAPSKELLDDFNKEKSRFTPDSGFESAIHYAWERSHYEERFREQIKQSDAAMARLRELAQRARDHDVYLICYEGEDKPCHRRLLLDIAEKELGADVDASPVTKTAAESESEPRNKEQTLPLFERVS